MKNLIGVTIRVLASYWLCIILLFLLLVLTFLGTIEQVDHGLYAVQEKYFNSLFLVHELPGGIPLPLPGVYLITIVLFVNILMGAIFRAPKSWQRPGMLIAHGGILYLLIAGFATFHYSQSGHMRLFEGETSSRFQSYYDWSLTINEIGETESGARFSIDGSKFEDMSPSDSRVFRSDLLPFDIELSRLMKNARPRIATESDSYAVDGVVIDPAPLDKDAARNFWGVSVAVLDNETGERQEGMVWGASRLPWVVTVDGRQYALRLEHTQYDLPFAITLDEFIHDLHPGTSMAANFESRVTMTREGVQRQIEIKMNQPLRQDGYTFYQSSWGPENAGPNTPLYSVFAVVTNPADQWPKYATYVVAFGLLIHFVQNLIKYLRRESRRRVDA